MAAKKSYNHLGEIQCFISLHLAIFQDITKVNLSVLHTRCTDATIAFGLKFRQIFTSFTRNSELSETCSSGAYVNFTYKP